MTEINCIPVPPRVKDLTGNRYGRWLVIGYVGSSGKYPIRQRWYCCCDCGERRVVTGSALKDGVSKSCGCARKETLKTLQQRLPRRIIHGMIDDPEYGIWVQMKYRCLNPNCKSWKNYGGRGITVCEKWKNDFLAFYEDMGQRPSPSYTLERIDNNGNYEPDNCKWATMKQQGINKRETVFLTANGETLPLVEWAERTGIKTVTLRSRLNRGWSDEQTVTTPLDISRSHR